MEKQTKIIIEIVGLLATMAAIAELFVRELYIAGTILLLIGFSIVVLIFYLRRKSPFTIKSIHYYYENLDDKGHEVKCRKKKVLRINGKYITSLCDRNFSASGKYEFTGTNIGDFLAPLDEGGTTSVYTYFKQPLPNDKDITHEIFYTGWDSFTENRETVTALVTDPCELGLHVKFLSQRKPNNKESIKAFAIDNRSRPIIVDDIEISNDLTQIDLLIPKAPSGYKYVVEWEW